LRNNAEAVGIVSQPPPWRVLRELSELPAKVPVDVEEFYCDRDEVRISGGTDSFEAVNRIRDQLAASPLFTGVEVAESRKSLEGNRVEFRLRLPLSSKGRTP
jgi:Tfp pilus assembly protein PilN